jgi:hypothetical protein
MTIRKLVSKAVAGTVGAYVGKAGEISFDPTLGAFKLSDGVTPGGIAITEPTSINVADNRWYVDPSRTDINPAASTGNVNNPFLTVTAALAYIEARIADGTLSNFDPTAGIVLNPQFIILTSSTVENITLTRGHIYIVGETPNAGHVPIWIRGTVTITPGAVVKNTNDFGLFHVAVIASGAHVITVNGTNPARVYLEDVYAYANTSGYSCVYMTNSGATTKLEMTDCTVGRASGSTYLIDVQSEYCKIDNLETNGTGQVLNYANASSGTLLNSVIDADTGSVITLSGTAQFGMGNCILNNTSAAANSHGVTMSGTATIQFGVCTFNIPAAQATNRAINGVAGNVVLYSGPIFQYGTCDKISTAITLIALDTTFTAV